MYSLTLKLDLDGWSGEGPLSAHHTNREVIPIYSVPHQALEGLNS